MRLPGLFLVAASLLTALPAAANDTAAVLGTGGLVFTKAPGIEMVTEDLTVGPSRITVRYEFLNRTDRDITLRIAFPLPDIDHRAIEAKPVIQPEGTPPDNFVGFTVTVDGKPVKPELEARALVGTRDVTGTLRRHGVPLSFFHDGIIDDIVAAKPEAVRKELLAAGIVAPTFSDFAPNWVLKTAFHWEQTFPAGRPVVVEHSYKPVVGGEWFTADDLKLVGTPKDPWKDYCIDAGTRRGIARFVERRDSPPVRIHLIDYILTTARNWDGPIGRFTLTLDKEKPGAILSVCLDGVTKTSPTTFRWERAPFTPTKDLRVMVVEPLEMP